MTDEVMARIEAEREKHREALRDQFACAALTGMLAAETNDFGLANPDGYATRAYEYADLMLTARTLKKETQP